MLFGCGLYLSDSTDSTYEEMVSFGLERLSSKPVVVEDLGHKFMSSQLEEVEFSKWHNKETLTYNNKTIDTYISTSERCVLLIPSE